ncbi:2-amino-4-hydroxy-6-hydroxymethyldihydropteridinepyrophosphokinase [Paraliobacillus sp. PM-2]|uniref:2-amino-4-hydroxy-6- hydroxymethyldihydropteridine diphosphokinase n=1 Tax=Paraliobacillus sp. PM-2 TaxID=1462524 RepID=UPI00061C58FD|nr:2-amino-4-hydroxy-6-hydroxymethyldihydropteridine diphosphokinase [Paraliobacillus sp. PM-2]CQR47446.1 2-amino-4-hydroxy-6-hydroxymethyldihydropteridinepyrophosphokinase [Paraliobacillus sp. PM-2]
MNSCYIALGSNIPPRDYYLNQAIEALRQEEAICIRSVSSIYETIPVGYTDQSNFLNMVIEIETKFSPTDLLKACQKIEQKLGRKRIKRWGPRTIDLDILLYNQENMKTEYLVIPHPRMHERAFVLVPLYEIAPSAYIPSLQKKVSNALSNIPMGEKKGVVKWKFPINGDERRD